MRQMSSTRVRQRGQGLRRKAKVNSPKLPRVSEFRKYPSGCGRLERRKILYIQPPAPAAHKEKQYHGKPYRLVRHFTRQIFRLRVTIKQIHVQYRYWSVRKTGHDCICCIPSVCQSQPWRLCPEKFGNGLLFEKERRMMNLILLFSISLFSLLEQNFIFDTTIY